MELSTEQIDYLFAFTKKKMVHFYDLQIEIVDHLAERIKEEMQLDASLDFTNALDLVYKGFGVFGFAHIVQERQNALQKAGVKTFMQEFKNQFAWPLLLRSLVIITTVYLLASNLSSYWFAIITGVLLGFGALANLRQDLASIKAKRKLISFHVPFNWISFIIIQIGIQYIIGLWDVSNIYPITHTWVAVAIIVPGFLATIIYWELSQRLKIQAKENYPEAFA